MKISPSIKTMKISYWLMMI